MIYLYSSGGAGDFELLGETLESAECEKLLRNIRKVLTARGNATAAELLETIPFCLYEGLNHFNDEFKVLCARLPLSHYEELRRLATSPTVQSAFRQIAKVAQEDFGIYVRFIAVQLQMGTDEHIAPIGHLFICHASEDKESVALPLAQKLEAMGFKVAFPRKSGRLVKTHG